MQRDWVISRKLSDRSGAEIRHEEVSMHAKRKGNIGQFATALFQSKFGFSIFSEDGDISRIDLIAELNGRVIKFQCKAVTSKNGKIEVPLRKCGPNYRYRYCAGLIDLFAVYDLTDGRLYFLPDPILRRHKNTFVLRKSLPRNNQSKRIHRAEDFLAERILRDYTGNTPPTVVEGDDIVQTATIVARET